MICRDLTKANKARLDNRWAALSAMLSVTLTRHPVRRSPPPQRCQRSNVRLNPMNAAWQITSALIVGVCYYMLAMAMTVYDGILSMMFQPIVGTILTLIAIAMMSLLGLPIRLMRPLNDWWRKHWWIVFVIGTIAFLMMYASWMPQFRTKILDPETDMEVASFHPVLAVGGWLLTIFAVLHFYPPLPWMRSKPQ